MLVVARRIRYPNNGSADVVVAGVCVYVRGAFFFCKSHLPKRFILPPILYSPPYRDSDQPLGRSDQPFR